MINCTFFIHYTKLVDRLVSITRQIEENKDFFQKYEIITEYDQEQISEVYSKYFDESEEKKKEKCIFVNPNGPEMNRKMQGAELSNALKHFICYERIASMDYVDNDYFLILEDDFILKRSPSVFLETLSKLSALEHDIVFCGEGSLLKGDNTEFIYFKENPCTNGICTYIIKKKAARLIKEFIDINKISFPMDHELNYVIYKENLKVYWTTPVTKHGSINGYFSGTVIR